MCMYVCMYVCSYVCIVWFLAKSIVCMYLLCALKRKDASRSHLYNIKVCVCVCIYVCMYLCMYACIVCINFKFCWGGPEQSVRGTTLCDVSHYYL